MLHDLISQLKDWWAVQGGIERLAHLDDRLLADLGIEREDIPRYVRGELLKPADPPAAQPAVALGSPHPRIPRGSRADGRRVADAYAPRKHTAVSSSGTGK